MLIKASLSPGRPGITAMDLSHAEPCLLSLTGDLTTKDQNARVSHGTLNKPSTTMLPSWYTSAMSH